MGPVQCLPASCRKGNMIRFLLGKHFPRKHLSMSARRGEGLGSVRQDLLLSCSPRHRLGVFSSSFTSSLSHVPSSLVQQIQGKGGQVVNSLFNKLSGLLKLVSVKLGTCNVVIAKVLPEKTLVRKCLEKKLCWQIKLHYPSCSGFC